MFSLCSYLCAKFLHTMFWIVVTVAILLIGIAFAGIGIKMFLVKGGKFERRCENEGSKICVCGGHKCKKGIECPNKKQNTTN